MNMGLGHIHGLIADYGTAWPTTGESPCGVKKLIGVVQDLKSISRDQSRSRIE